MPRDDVAVKIDGLASLRRGLRDLDPQIEKDMRQAFKTAADKIAVTAGANAPRRTGELAHSIQPYATGNRVGIRSRLPYAPVVHWGGTIRPRGVPIHFKRTEFITRAAEDHQEELAQDVADATQHAIDQMVIARRLTAR